MLKRLFPELPNTIVLDSIPFEIRYIRRKHMKTMVLRVENAGEIQLSAAHFSARKIKAFIHQHQSWILEKNQMISQRYACNQQFYYLGKAYPIEHHEGRFDWSEEGVRLNPHNAMKQSMHFYKKQALFHIPDRVKYWEEKTGLTVTQLRFRKAKRRWGSCNSLGVITINPYVMRLSMELIDYVIVHELCHLVHMNHSKDFYTLLERYLPDHRQCELGIAKITEDG